MKDSELIDQAIGLIADESRWCKGVLKRTNAGVEQHCIAGALMEVTGNNWSPMSVNATWFVNWRGSNPVSKSHYEQLLDQVGLTLDEMDQRLNVSSYNDAMEHSDAVALLEKTRARLQEAGE